MAIVQLPRGKSTIIDDSDLEFVKSFRWYASDGTHTSYVRRTTDKAALHRLLLCCCLGLQVDHINGNGLDNRRVNLRVVTVAQNQQNRRKTMTGSSQFKGVVFEKRLGRWKARITVNKKLIALGYFSAEIDAALAYDVAAREFFGEFAYLNSPQVTL